MHSPSVAFFDVDHTLTRRSTGTHFALEAVRQGVISPWRLAALPFLYIGYRLGPRQRDSSTASYSSLPAFAGLDESWVRQAAQDAVHNRILPDLRPTALSMIQEAKQSGALVILATSTFDFIAEPLARELGIGMVIASPVEFAGGKTTGRVPGGLVLGPRKLQLCKDAADERGVALSSCSFYSDSVHDLPLLLAVGKPVAVHPDLRLRRHARLHSWLIVG